jgi:hypothetical protein
MIENLTQHGQQEHAKCYLKLFPFFEKDSDDYKVSEFLTFEPQMKWCPGLKQFLSLNLSKIWSIDKNFIYD